MKKKSIILLLSLVLAVSLVGCGKKDEEDKTISINELSGETEAETESVEETEEVDEDIVPEGMYRSELTNEPIDESLKDQRPMAVMVDNEKTALPHFGVSEADVVYEIMNSTLNDRITRLMVLVKDWEKIEQLGSIRSVRPTNILLAAEWNAILCHDGGPFYVDPYFAEDYADHFSGTFSRVNNGKAREFTEYVVTGDIEKNFSNSKVDREYNEHYEGPHYQFADKSNPVDLTDADGSFDCKEIQLPFKHNGSTLKYNEDTQTYDYYEYGSAHVDAGNNNQVTTFKNLLIQSCTFHQYDENGYMIYNCISQGEAGYYITNGKAIPVTWQKLGETQPTRYYDSTGTEITINTGKTYVSLVPDDGWDDIVIK